MSTNEGSLVRDKMSSPVRQSDNALPGYKECMQLQQAQGCAGEELGQLSTSHWHLPQSTSCMQIYLRILCDSHKTSEGLFQMYLNE